MQPELLSLPQSDETEEALKARIERLYKIYGQNWRPFFEQIDERLVEVETNPMPWWLIRRARQLASTSSSMR
jgi:hypothetical protein